MDWQKITADQAILIEQLRVKNAALKEHIAVLEKNSATSSKLPKVHQQIELVAKPFILKTLENTVLIFGERVSIPKYSLFHFPLFHPNQ